MLCMSSFAWPRSALFMHALLLQDSHDSHKTQTLEIVCINKCCAHSGMSLLFCFRVMCTHKGCTHVLRCSRSKPTNPCATLHPMHAAITEWRGCHGARARAHACARQRPVDCRSRDPSAHRVSLLQVRCSPARGPAHDMRDGAAQRGEARRDSITPCGRRRPAVTGQGARKGNAPPPPRAPSQQHGPYSAQQDARLGGKFLEAWRVQEDDPWGGRVNACP